MADNQQSGGGEKDSQIAKLGGPTSVQMGTEYELVSSAVKDAAEAMGEATEGKAAGGQHDADSGREPEEYIDKQTGKGSTEGDAINKAGDIAGPIGREAAQHPGSAGGQTERGT